MSERISQSELERYLWGAAVLLRGNVDATQYKQYIFPLLFFKRISDVYEEETEAATAKYGDMIEFYPEKELHKFILPEGCRWNDIRNVTDDVGQAIVNTFREIERVNDKMEGVFGDGAWTNKKRLPDRLLRDLIDHFSMYTLNMANCPEDELGNAYEYLIKQFADDSGHTAQEFYTNRTVVHLMTELLKPQPGESVYDPTCGTAGMLISSVAYLKERGLEWRNLHLYGQEIKPLTSAIARMNLFLHGFRDFDVAYGDTLKDPDFIENGQPKKFDLVLANPPYSIKEWDRGSFENDKYGRNFLGTPPQGRADFAFFQHIIRSMKPGTGRCAILFPHGILTRDEESDMRKKLIEMDVVESVIGIAKNLFYNSPMEACIVICRMNKPIERQGKVLLIDARGLVTRKNSESYLEDEHISSIVDCYKDFKKKDGFSAIATNEEIIKNDGSLGISKYVRKGGKISDNEDAISETIGEWMAGQAIMQEEYAALVEMLPDEGGNVNG